MPIFFVFNNHQLFGGGPNRNPIFQRDFGFYFPALLFFGSFTGAPQLLIPFGLYLIFGTNMNVGIDGIQNNSILKFLLFCFVALVFWDFISAPFPSPIDVVDEQQHRPEEEEDFYEQPSYTTFSLFSELSLFFLASLLLAILNQWDDIHAYISRTLPRSWSLRFREFTRTMGINPRNSTGLGPASPEAIASLESLIIRENGAEGDCSICLEAFKMNDNAKKLHCKHVFHTSCLMPWLNQRSSCPVCRASVESFEQQREQQTSSSSSSSSEHSFSNGATTSSPRTTSSFPPRSTTTAPHHHAPAAVWNALRSVLDPLGALNNHLPQVENREALMNLSIRELRERAAARNISLTGLLEKNEIVDLLLTSRSDATSHSRI